MKVYVVMQGVDIDGYHKESNLFGIYSEESTAKRISEGLVDSYYFDTEVDSNIPELFGYISKYYCNTDELFNIQNLVYVPKKDSYIQYNFYIDIFIRAKNIDEARMKMNQLVEEYKKTSKYKEIMDDLSGKGILEKLQNDKFSKRNTK